jgi:hypothetical protein
VIVIAVRSLLLFSVRVASVRIIAVFRRFMMSLRLEQDPSVLEAFAWSESIIADVLHRRYPNRMDSDSSPPRSERLLLLHLYFWKALIFGSEALSSKQRRALVAAAFEAGFDTAFLADVDDEVMAELLEIVLRRFRTTPIEARRYHLLLMSVAARLRVSALADHVVAERPRHLEPVGSSHS